MVADADVQAHIHSRAPEQTLLTAARAAGLRSMREDGERLVASGVTSPAEVIRVTRD
jgi:general secretion pathway protein E